MLAQVGFSAPFRSYPIDHNVSHIWLCIGVTFGLEWGVFLNF